LYSLFSILQSNKFRLRPIEGTESDKILNKNYPFYFSTSRTRNNSFSSIVGSSTCILQLNGTKLAERYKGSAIDYWGEDFRKINPKGYEQEDRIFSKKRAIPNALSYIQAVTIMVVVGNESGRTRDMLRKIALELKVHKIPLRIYTDKNAFKTDNKAKAVKIVDILNSMPAEKNKPYRSRRDSSQNTLSPWMELIFKPNTVPLTSETKDTLHRYLSYPTDAIRQFKNELHNSTSGDTVLREDGGKIQEYLFKHKLDAKQLIEFLQNKWKKYLS
jgi:hypothetical protein